MLVKNEPKSVAVRVESMLLAETRTLTECKRAAELLDAAGRVAVARRRRRGRLIITLTAFAFVPSLAPPRDLILFLVLLVGAAGSIGFLAGTYVAGSHLTIRDLTSHSGPVLDDRLCLWVTRYAGRFCVSM